MKTKPTICIVVGTRPEAIKMSPVYFAIRDSSRLTPLLLSTGQHREMLRQALDAFEIRPDHDLDLMQPGQTLASVTASVVSRAYEYFDQTKPDAVLVQGDTTTVFSAALAAFYAGIPVGHVEAGLRTYNSLSPWPEEMNRRLTSPIATWSFAPTTQSHEQLLSEKIPSETCFVTGNTVIDALLWMRDRVKKREHSVDDFVERFGVSRTFAEQFLPSSGSTQPPRRWILVTGHRRESIGAGFERICEGILSIVEKHNIGVLFPVHLNPRVRDTVKKSLANHENIQLIDPLGYEDFVWLMDNCYFILSDSGGVQEEAPSLGKPVLVTRETTERPEGVSAGTCRLVGSDPRAICNEADLLLSNEDEYTSRSQLQNPYGDGEAAARICRILESKLCDI